MFLHILFNIERGIGSISYSVVSAIPVSDTYVWVSFFYCKKKRHTGTLKTEYGI